MNRLRYVGDLFASEPKQWGLRGDPYLWREMQKHLSTTLLASRWSEAEETIVRAFFELTEQSIETEESFHLERFSHGGMSSGYIDPEFWRSRGMPFLRDRYEET